MIQSIKNKCCDSPDSNYHILGETFTDSEIYVYAFIWDKKWQIIEGSSFVTAIEDFCESWYAIPDDLKVVKK